MALTTLTKIGKGITSLFKAKGATHDRELSERFSDIINVKDYGAKGDNSDDYSGLQRAIDAVASKATAPLYQDALPILYLPYGSYKTSRTLNTDGVAGLTMYASQVTGTEKTQIYCSTDNSILSINNRQRYTLKNIMFNGDKTGNKSGAVTAMNQDALIKTTGGDSSLMLVENCDIRRAKVAWRETNKGIWLKFINTQFYNNELLFEAHNGVDSTFFLNCDLEGNDVLFNIGDGAIGKFVMDGCYLEVQGGERQLGYINCASPTITNNRLFATQLFLGKGVTNPTVFGNTVVGFESRIHTFPSFTTNFHVDDPSIAAVKRRSGNKILPLDQSNSVTTNSGYISGDGLDYVIATNISRVSNGSSDVYLDYRVDSSIKCRDKITVKAASDQFGSTSEYTTYGVLNNSGTGIYVGTSDASLYNQHNVYYQSLIQNGTFNRATVDEFWEKQGGIQTVKEGEYLKVTNSGSNGNFAYNRVIHIPDDCQQIQIMMRVKEGTGTNLSVGGISGNAQFPHILSKYFHNYDTNTYDDLYTVFVDVSSSKLLKRGVAIRCNSGETTYIRSVCVIPVTESATTRFSGEFTYNPTNVPSGGVINTNIGFDGDNTNDIKIANSKDSVTITPSFDAKGVVVQGYVNSTGVITMKLYNPTSSSIDLAEGSFRWVLTKQ